MKQSGGGGGSVEDGKAHSWDNRFNRKIISMASIGVREMIDEVSVKSSEEFTSKCLLTFPNELSLPLSRFLALINAFY